MQEIEEELREFIIKNYLFGQEDVQFENDDSFMERGIIDSTGVLELIAFLEKKYQIKLEGKDLIPENLDSITRLRRFLEKNFSWRSTNQQSSAYRVRD